MGSTRRRTITGLLALVAALAVLGAGMALAQSDEESAPPSTDDDGLLTRLDELDGRLPDPQPEDVEIDAEETWGALEGDFGGAAATIGTVRDELEQLFVDADDADGTVAEAVAAVARGWLDLREGYDALAQWESNDLAFPLDTEDDDDVATGADEARGDAERGLRQILTGQQRHLGGYVALRTEGAAASADAQARLGARAAAAERFDREVRPQVHRLLSLPTTMEVHIAERFETDAPGLEARSRSYTVTCVERDAAASGDEEPATPAPGDVEVPAQDRVDCPDLPDGVEFAESGGGGDDDLAEAADGDGEGADAQEDGDAEPEDDGGEDGEDA